MQVSIKKSVLLEESSVDRYYCVNGCCRSFSVLSMVSDNRKSTVKTIFLWYHHQILRHRVTLLGIFDLDFIYSFRKYDYVPVARHDRRYPRKPRPYSEWFCITVSQDNLKLCTTIFWYRFMIGIGDIFYPNWYPFPIENPECIVQAPFLVKARCLDP